MNFLELLKRKFRKAPKYRREYDNGIIIEYDIEPPNFRTASDDNPFAIEDCGSCKFCEKQGNTFPTCGKYGVEYCGIGCLTKTVCDDFEDTMLDLLTR